MGPCGAQDAVCTLAREGRGPGRNSPQRGVGRPASPPGGEAVAGRRGRGGPRAVSQAEPQRGAATVCRAPLAAWVDRMGPGGLGGSCEAREEPGPSRTRGLAAGAKGPSLVRPRLAPVGGEVSRVGAGLPSPALARGLSKLSKDSCLQWLGCSRPGHSVVGRNYPPHVRHFTDRKVWAP